MVDRRLLSPCGLHCGVCGIRAAHRSGSERFKAAWARAYRLKPEQIACEGCRSEAPFFFCASCRVRDCADDKGLDGCHECDEWPCERVAEYPFKAAREQMMRAVPVWRELGTEAWVAHEQRFFSCQACGAELFRGVTRCKACGEPWAPPEVRS